MSAPDRADELDALATLRMLREHLDVSAFSAEDRLALSEWWATAGEKAEDLKPKTVAVEGITAAAMFYDPNEEGLEPHLIPAALAMRAFNSAIQLGLPGAEHLAEEFLRDCGFDRSLAREMLLQMVAGAPPPDVETLN